MTVVEVDGRAIVVSRGLLRVVRMRDEPYECLSEPESYLEKVKLARVGGDVFTFLQEMSERAPKYGHFHQESHSLAVVPVSTYEHWWKRQIRDKTRNMIRKSQKSKVECRVVECDDEFVDGVAQIYKETPVRQGHRFKHYEKDVPTIRRELTTFSELSVFIGAFVKGELVGFAKCVQGKNVVSLMHIIAKVAHRDKAPTNALIAKSVELCAESHVPLLHYGVWSRRGLGDFKKHHGFVCHTIPRYFVPLSLRGRMLLRLGLHRRVVERLPEGLVDKLISVRSRWHAFLLTRARG